MPKPIALIVEEPADEWIIPVAVLRLLFDHKNFLLSSAYWPNASQIHLSLHHKTQHELLGVETWSMK